MNRYRDWGYVQARLQARHASLGDPATWRALEAAGSAAHLLQTARNTPLRPWVLALGPGQEVHRVEALIRRQLREHIAEVAQWMPEPWRPAIHWCTWLPELPALDHLRTGEPAPPWMADDPLLRPLAGATPELRRQALAEAVQLAPLLEPATRGLPLRAAWWRHEQNLLPRPLAFVPPLRRALLAAARAGSGEEPPMDRAARRQLAAVLERGFRRHAFSPEAAFIHLALTALRLERLRGLLSRRLLFPPAEAA